MGIVKREKVGVVGDIVKWNLKMMIGEWKIEKDIEEGNQIVLKKEEGDQIQMLRMEEI